MLEMATVLVAIGTLIVIAYEFSFTLNKKRVWGENYKSIF